MEAFELLDKTYRDKDVLLTPGPSGGAELDVESYITDTRCFVDLTRLELVALRDWLIAYTG